MNLKTSNWIALALSPLAALSASHAEASVAETIPLSALIRAADAVVTATPVEQYAEWDGGRIYTFTRLKLDDTMGATPPAGSFVSVRTRGGIVGKIGQQVEGEARFELHSPALVFLRAASSTTFEVVGRAQGEYTIETPRTSLPVLHSLATRELRLTGARYTEKGAVQELDGARLQSAMVNIRAIWSQSHAK